MPRPKTKTELLNLSKLNYYKLNEFIDNLSEKDQHIEFSKGTLNRNVRDVVAHLHHWHLLLLNWSATSAVEDKPAMPAEGYTWKTLPEYNRKVQQQWKTTSLEESRKLLSTSFLQVRQLIERHSEDELFEKKKYLWTGSTSMAAYIISATSSHYEWAFKLLKKCLK